MNPPVLSPGPVVRISPPAPLHMHRQWFDVTDADHFWMRRRLEVLQKVFSDVLRPGAACAEVGCGAGVLQGQLARCAGLAADGFDLDEQALAVARPGGTCYLYDVLARDARFRDRYELLFLFDVLEHIEDPVSFLSACAHHLKPGGGLLVNVPARQEFHSHYDRAVGHLRRYSIESLGREASEAGFRLERVTYWGFPLILLLLLRRAMGPRGTDDATVRAGMAVRSRLMNQLLLAYSRIELLPQTRVGSSLMALFRKETA